jgi:hypothetical protein
MRVMAPSLGIEKRPRDTASHAAKNGASRKKQLRKTFFWLAIACLFWVS